MVGGAGLTETVALMIEGAKGMMSAILRILAAGVFAGVLIELGAAAQIAKTIVGKLEENNSLIALSIATLVLTAVGVFIYVAVITVAPIALAIAKKASLTRTSILIAMIGGGKSGNIMSPNSNAIAATASTTSGTAVGSQVFGPTITQLGVAPLSAAAMIHSGATVLDHLPHGSFFHATGGSVFMDMKERLIFIPYESLIGLSMTIVSTIIYGLIF